MKIALVYGTAAPAGRLSQAMAAFAAELHDLGAETGTIDLSARLLPFAGTHPLPGQAEALAEVKRLFDEAQAAALFVPIYRAAPPGVLKNLLDLLPVEVLESKPVALVSMGASLHHYLAAATSLKPVLDWFAAISLPPLYLTSRSFGQETFTTEALGEITASARTLADVANRLSGLQLLPRPLAASAGG